MIRDKLFKPNKQTKLTCLEKHWVIKFTYKIKLNDLLVLGVQMDQVLTALQRPFKASCYNKRCSTRGGRVFHVTVRFLECGFRQTLCDTRLGQIGVLSVLSRCHWSLGASLNMDSFRLSVFIQKLRIDGYPTPE